MLETSVSREEYNRLLKRFENESAILSCYKDLAFRLEDLLRSKDKERETEVMELTSQLNDAKREIETLRRDLKKAKKRMAPAEGKEMSEVGKKFKKMQQDNMRGRVAKGGSITEDIVSAKPSKNIPIPKPQSNEKKLKGLNQDEVITHKAKLVGLRGAALASHAAKLQREADELAKKARRKGRVQRAEDSDPDPHPD